MRFVKTALSFILMFTLLNLVLGDAVLSGMPVKFTMSGFDTRIPDAGGAAKKYCILTIGYVGKSWLGVQFASSGSNTDFLALQISDFYTNNGNSLNTGHQVTYTDYYKSSGVLVTDTITTNDINSYTYSLTKSYSLQIIKYVGSNNGQDWDGETNKYSVQKICFYSSDFTFDASAFDTFYSACYYYEIDNYVSTFVGLYLKSFTINGYSTGIYGYIDGPIVANRLYFYQNCPLFSYVKPPAVVIEIGTTSGNYGQDYYAWSSVASQCGDYYGTTLSQKSFDNNAAGFQNPALVLNHWNANTSDRINDFSSTSLRIHFDRAVYTYDQYDKQMLSTFLFCMYLYSSGSINGALSDKGCEVVELSPVYVQMGMTSKKEETLLLYLVMIMLVMISFI